MADHPGGRKEFADAPGAESPDKQKQSVDRRSGNVTAGEVRSGNDLAFSNAQATVDENFPKVSFEPHPVNDFKEDLQFAPHTDSYVAIDPLVRFRDKGWTQDLDKDLREHLTKNILESGGAHQFGATLGEWEDARTTLEMARKVNHLHAFVDELNKDIQTKAPGADIKVNIESFSSKEGGLLGFGGTKKYDLDITVDGKIKQMHQPGDNGEEVISDRENQSDFLKPEAKINSNVMP